MSSDAIIIRDAAIARIEPLTTALFKSVRKTPMYTVQPEWLPLCSVYMLRDSWQADGDPRTGYPRFIATMSLAVSGQIAASNDGEAEDLLDQGMSAIETALLIDDGRSSNTFLRMLEGVQSVTREHIYGQGRAGETPTSEIRFRMDCLYRVYELPTITDAFKTMHVSVEPVIQDKAWEAGKVPQIIVQYDIPQT